jgi:hypothetical protein
MRSKGFTGGDGGVHYNQCIYDALGQLLLQPPSAGTVDWKEPGTLPHFEHDVEPVMLANELDGGGDIDVLVWPDRLANGKMKVPPGANVLRYYEVRPTWHE